MTVILDPEGRHVQIPADDRRQYVFVIPLGGAGRRLGRRQTVIEAKIVDRTEDIDYWLTIITPLMMWKHFLVPHTLLEE